MKGSSLDFLQKVVREVERFGLVDDVELTTAHTPLLFHAKRLNSRLRVGAFFYQPPAWMPVRLAQEHARDWAGLLGIDVAHLSLSLITAEFVQELRRCGLTVAGSNLDSVEDIQKGLELGVDSFSTGRLGMALQLRDEFVA